MSRPLRLDHAGAIWHITSRGNERRTIFRDDDDRTRFLCILRRVIGIFRWQLHAYVLMGNHYHLLLETPEPTLSRGMRQLNGLYTQSFNRHHLRCGHLFQGRFKAILVERDSHLLELARYVVLNPVRAGLVETAQQWKWSNYRATAGLMAIPDWLEVDWTLAQFGPAAHRQRLYRGFVAQGSSSSYAPWKQLVGQIYLGSALFRQGIQAMVGEAPRSRDFPRVQRLPFRPDLDRLIAATIAQFGASERDLLRKRQIPARLALAYLARNDGGLKFGEFAEALGVRERAASHLAASGERLSKTDTRFRQRLRLIRASLGKFAGLRT